MEGYTYFIQAVSGGPIKIGYTRKDPVLRLRDLQTGSPLELRVVAVISGNQEGSLHRKFAACRVQGEWFGPQRELVEYIRDHAHSLHHQPRLDSRIDITGGEILPPGMGSWFYDKMDHEEV